MKFFFALNVFLGISGIFKGVYLHSFHEFMIGFNIITALLVGYVVGREANNNI